MSAVSTDDVKIKGSGELHDPQYFKACLTPFSAGLFLSYIAEANFPK
jgi:hypothetical protein